MTNKPYEPMTGTAELSVTLGAEEVEVFRRYVVEKKTDSATEIRRALRLLYRVADPGDLLRDDQHEDEQDLRQANRRRVIAARSVPTRQERLGKTF